MIDSIPQSRLERRSKHNVTSSTDVTSNYLIVTRSSSISKLQPKLYIKNSFAWTSRHAIVVFYNLCLSVPRDAIPELGESLINIERERNIPSTGGQNNQFRKRLFLLHWWLIKLPYWFKSCAPYVFGGIFFHAKGKRSFYKRWDSTHMRSDWTLKYSENLENSETGTLKFSEFFQIFWVFQYLVRSDLVLVESRVTHARRDWCGVRFNEPSKWNSLPLDFYSIYTLVTSWTFNFESFGRFCFQWICCHYTCCN